MITPLTLPVSRLHELEELVAACEEDFECEADDAEPVSTGNDGPSRLTFGMIRRAKAALLRALPSVEGNQHEPETLEDDQARSMDEGRLDRSARNDAGVQGAATPAAHDTPKGTYNCPVCGWNVPHREHAGELVERLHFELNAWESWWQHVVLMLKSGIRPGCSLSQAKRNCDELIAGRGASSPAPFISPMFDRQPFIPQPLAASPASVEGSETPWQPIETYEHGDRADVAANVLIATEGNLVGEAYFNPKSGGGTWWWAGTMEGEYADSPIYSTVTHWMPLPQPPASSSCGAASQEPVSAKYHELLYAVESKHAGESRHDTALRYIRLGERRPSQTASAPHPQEKPE